MKKTQKELAERAAVDFWHGMKFAALVAVLLSAAVSASLRG